MASPIERRAPTFNLACAVTLPSGPPDAYEQGMAKSELDRLFDDWHPRRWPRLAGHGLLRAYQLSISMLVGRWCRHLPSCSAYMDEAIMRHGLWAGGWIGLARLCRCHPWGTSGIDNAPEALPPGARWFLPWRYGRWRWRGGRPVCEPAGNDHRS